MTADMHDVDFDLEDFLFMTADMHDVGFDLEDLELAIDDMHKLEEIRLAVASWSVIIAGNTESS